MSVDFAIDSENKWQDTTSIMQDRETEFEAGPRRVRVLLIEDEEMVRAFASFCLEEQGCEVFQAGDADEAAYVWSRENGAFDLMVTDISLPGASGITIAENFRALSPDLPILFTSGYDEAVGLSSDGGGYVGFLPKPYSCRSLVEAFRKALSLAATPSL